MSWYQLLDMHQKDMFESYIAYKKYYGNKYNNNYGVENCILFKNIGVPSAS